jgi:microcin C transport system permease protein
MTFFSPITIKRIQRFRRIRRGFVSLILITAAIFLSLFAEYLANSRAVMVSYEGKWYFPTWTFHPGRTFGENYDHEADYRALSEKWKSERSDNWILMPLIPYNPYELDMAQEGNPPHAPNDNHWLGTDDRGRDVFVRLLYGFRIAIFFTLILTFFSTIIGTIIGCMMGYFGGRFDLYFQRIIEIWGTIPFLYLVIILASILNPNFMLLVVIMTLFGWLGITYYMRTEVYREKAKDYSHAAKALGASHWRMIFKHLLPNSMVPLITFTPFSLVQGISSLTGLDYLGYGLPAPTPSWGELMNQGLENPDKLWLSMSPFAAIVVTLILFTFIGEAVREAFDPKEYSKYS